jgi:predicted dehydrogenase
MLKVAIVGCGKIADEHAAQIGRIPDCDIVAACDREPLMVRQLAERFPVKRCFTDLAELLTESRPDVVHITTPPQSHFSLARQCLEFGCHVYVEKPFTVTATETHQLITLADKLNLKLTAGHDCQFRAGAERMRALIATGYLGGMPVHMEGHYCYEIGRDAYSGALLGDKSHWVRQLPGKLLHNIISHGIATIAEYMDDNPKVIVHGYTSPLLKSLGEVEIVDELRVIISANEQMTAFFTFSSQLRPCLHQFRIYGPKNGIILDHDHETVIKLHGLRYKSYAEKFIPPVNFAKQYLDNLAANVCIFMKNDFHMKAGMKHLIERFYLSIINNIPVPIPYREILLTATIMDDIFTQLNAIRNTHSDRVVASSLI